MSSDAPSLRDFPEAVRRADAPGGVASAARELARQTLEYLGWFDGTYSAERLKLLDSDAALRDRALAVYAALGDPAPALENPRRRKS